MRYAFGPGCSTLSGTGTIRGLDGVLRAHGHVPVPSDVPDVDLVLHCVEPEDPRPFRRRGRGTYVVALAPWTGGAAPSEGHEAFLQRHYPTLIRSLANLLVLVPVSADAADEGGAPSRPEPARPPSASLSAHVVTLERGAYTISGVGDDFFEHLYRALEPLAASRLVIDNVFEEDLPEHLAQGDEHTRALAAAGRRLAELDLLPAPFPIREMLSERDFRHVQRLYSIGGLSYGNLSVRETGDRFWMSGSGVDKSRLEKVGRDFLLVKGYDPERNAIVLSVPRGGERNRVSVDAIEHWMIYTEHPSVGAILHVHAWMDGVRSTAINYPCGSLELAQAVAAALREEPDPGRAVIGLRNHGLTITGPSLEEIFARVEGRLRTQVPMT